MITKIPLFLLVLTVYAFSDPLSNGWHWVMTDTKETALRQILKQEDGKTFYLGKGFIGHSSKWNEPPSYLSTLNQFNSIFLKMNFLDNAVGFAAGFRTNGSVNSIIPANNIYALNLGFKVLGGSVISTKDGGKTWKALEVPTKQILTSINFNDANTGLAVGDSGVILRTKDGGSNWTFIESGTRETFNDVDWSSATDAVAVGKKGTLMHSNDGGITWTQNLNIEGVAPNGVMHYNFNTVKFIGNSTGYVVGTSSIIIKTVDGGASWKIQGAYPASNLMDINFWDSKNGFAVGIQGAGTTLGLGAIFKTANGGDVWESVPNTFQELRSAVYISKDSMMAVGRGPHGFEYGLGSYFIWNGTISAAKYADIPNPLGNYTSGSCFNRDTCYAFTNTNVVATRDGWKTFWTKAIQNFLVAGGSFLNPEIGFAVGAGRLIAKTKDAGLSWTLVELKKLYRLTNVHAIDEARVIAIGDLGTILLSLDSGTTWDSIASPTTKNLLSLHFVSAQVGYAVGNEGTIIKTTDAGTSWELQTSGSIQHLRSVHFLDPDNGHAVGILGTILSTSNGGSTWTPEASGVNNELNTVQFVTKDIGFSAGNNVLLKTVNGGGKWESLIKGEEFRISRVYAANEDVVYAFGATSLILRSESGGESGIRKYTRTMLPFNENRNQLFIMGINPGPGSDIRFNVQGKRIILREP